MSFAKRLGAARAAYKKAQSQGTARLEEGDYQIKITKPHLMEPTKGKQKGYLVVVLPMSVAIGPDAGKKLMPKRYAVLDDKDQYVESLDYFKTDLERMGLDPDFDFGEIKKVLKQIDGMVFDCFVRDNPNNSQYQDCFINNPVDSLDDLDEEEDFDEEEEEEEDFEEEEEEEEEEEKPNRGRQIIAAAKKKASSKKSTSKKKSTKKKAASTKRKPNKKQEVEEEEEEWEEEEEEEEDDLLLDEDEDDEDEEWEEEEDEDWED